MFRSVMGHYKHGRATLNDKLIYKRKKWVTDDAKIVDFTQGTAMKDEVQSGPRTRDVHGHLERTTAKDTRELVDRIGSIVVQFRDGTTCGTGFKKDADDEGLCWDNRLDFLERWVEVKFQKHGMKDKPRLAGIVRYRPDLD